MTFNEPRMPVYSNVTGAPFDVPPSEYGAILARQLVEPVLWEQTLSGIVSSGKDELFECGPGAQVKAMVKRVDRAAHKKMKNFAA